MVENGFIKDEDLTELKQISAGEKLKAACLQCAESFDNVKESINVIKSVKGKWHKQSYKYHK